MKNKPTEILLTHKMTIESNKLGALMKKRIVGDVKRSPVVIIGQNTLRMNKKKIT